jgi:hypothetical protein
VGWWRRWRTTGSRTPRAPVALLADEEEKRNWRKEERTGMGQRCWAGARLPGWADSGQRRRDGGWAARAGRERKRVGPERERAQGDRIGFYKKE